MSASRRQDPYLGFRFRVELGSRFVAGFSEVSGLEIQMEPEEYEEGGLNSHTHRLPTRYSQPNVVLKRGLTDSRKLWEWITSALNENIERKSGRIILLNSAGEQSRDWSFTGAYPVRWAGPELQADQGAVAIETLELAHDGFATVGGLSGGGGSRG